MIDLHTFGKTPGAEKLAELLQELPDDARIKAVPCVSRWIHRFFRDLSMILTHIPDLRLRISLTQMLRDRTRDLILSSTNPNITDKIKTYSANVVTTAATIALNRNQTSGAESVA
jgi:hypothetical protein